MILGWTALRPSARERRLRAAALTVTAATAAALIGAFLFGDPRSPHRVAAAAGLALAALAMALYRTRRSERVGHQVAVGRDGTLRLRTPAAGDDAGRPARRVFVAPWLITLHDGAMLIPIWPDALPPDAFRRLLACARWAGEPSPHRSAPADPATDSHDDDRP